MKRFIFIYALSIILCLSPFIYGEELVPAGVDTLTSAGSDIIVDSLNVTGGAVELPSVTDDRGTSGRDLTAYEETMLPSEATTGTGVVFIPEEGIPGGAVIITSPEAISTTEAGITTTPGSILPADGIKDSLLTAPLAAAVGGYVSLTLTPDTFDMGTLTPNGTYTFTGKAVLTILAKSTWSLQVSGADFSNGIDIIPVSRIKCKASTSANYTTISASPTDILTNQPKAWPQGKTIQIDYQITIPPTDPAGSNFRSNITFTVF